MKKVLTLFAVLSFLFAEGQITNEYKFGTVYFKNGDTINGYVLAPLASNKIKFAKNVDDKPVKHNYSTILGYESFNEKYFYKNISGLVPQLLKLVQEGKVNLYMRTKYNRPSMGKPSSAHYSTAITQIGGGYENIYYLEKGESGLKKVNRIKKKHLIYFNDCEVLIDMIEKKEYRKTQFISIIHFYNNKCD